MKKRSRIVKKISSEQKTESDAVKKDQHTEVLAVNKVKEDESVDKTQKAIIEAKSESGQGRPLGKIEILSGFGLIGIVVGFLVGYGNLEVSNGVIYGIIGLLIGLATGYIPYLNIKQ